jgi:hypothetical protein
MTNAALSLVKLFGRLQLRDGGKTSTKLLLVTKKDIIGKYTITTL